MEAINIIFILFIIIGFGLIIYALVQAQKTEKENDEVFTIEQGIKKIRLVIDDADRAIDELNSLAEQVFLQFDEKKKELLFLYDIIEERQKSIIPKVDITLDQENNNLDGSEEKDNGKKANFIKYENPLLEQIKEMKEKGMKTSEISKILNIGQGEVDLIFELGKE